MRKSVSFLLVILLVIGMLGSVSAYDDEITWQGIPWGSSIEEVRTKLDDLFGKYDINQYDGSGRFILNSDGGYFSDWYSYEGYTTSLLVELKDIEMLGYPLKSIRFVFAFNGEESSLITIAIRPQAPDLSGKAFDKMIGIFVDDVINQYGKPIKNNSSELILQGGIHTAIYMYKGQDDFLWYGKTDAAVLLESIEKQSTGL